MLKIIFSLIFFMLLPLSSIGSSSSEGQTDSYKMCVSNKANECINAVCQTSSAIDCTQQCAQDAKNDCQKQFSGNSSYRDNDDDDDGEDDDEQDLN